MYVLRCNAHCQVTSKRMRLSPKSGCCKLELSRSRVLCCLGWSQHVVFLPSLFLQGRGAYASELERKGGTDTLIPVPVELTCGHYVFCFKHCYHCSILAQPARECPEVDNSIVLSCLSRKFTQVEGSGIERLQCVVRVPQPTHTLETESRSGLGGHGSKPNSSAFNKDYCWVHCG